VLNNSLSKVMESEQKCIERLLEVRQNFSSTLYESSESNDDKEAIDGQTIITIFFSKVLSAWKDAKPPTNITRSIESQDPSILAYIAQQASLTMTLNAQNNQAQ
jgi:hypothetical protein